MNPVLRSSRPARRVKTDPLDPLIRLWIFRLLVPLGGYREFLSSYGFGDDALAQYIDVAVPDAKYETRVMLATLRTMHRQLERKRSPRRLPLLLAGNIDRVGRLLDLDDAAKRILAFTVLLHADPWLQRAARQLGRVGASRVIDVLTMVLGLERASVRSAMSPRGALHESGLLRTTQHASDDLVDRLALLSHSMADRMLHLDADPIDLLCDIVAIAEPPRLGLPDYMHLPVLPVLQPYLRGAIDTSRAGVNVLVHGVPGSGKTQLAAALAQSVGCELFVLTAKSPTGDSIDGDTRLRAYQVAQGMLKQRRAMILFDETEDVFNDGFAALGGKSTAQSRKAWMNQTLENNPVPTFWLTNAVHGMDPAFVRRFDVVVEAALPSGKARQTLIERVCGHLVEPAVVAWLVELPRLAPAVVERAAKVIHAVGDALPADRTSGALMQLIDATLTAQGHGAVASLDTAGRSSGYDPNAVSADVDLVHVMQGLQRAGTGRLCLYGPPGTGKTAYGRWLSQQFDRPLHAKRVSDIVTPYVGETEQNLARVFRQAGQERAVLLIDEVDGFLRDRRHAQRSWEVTAVNEMLVQMEAFDGVFIASTNLMDDLDQAALRRFDLKVKFDYLRLEQAWRLLQSSCEALGLAAPPERARDGLGTLRNLTPGDFAAVERQHRFRPFADAVSLVSALAAECAIKNASVPRPIGFTAAPA